MRYCVLASFLILTTGCSSAWINKEYQVPNDDNVADMEFKALDTFRNNDTIEVGLLSQTSCKEKPNYSVVARLKTKRCFIDCSDIDKQYSTSNKLPANETLNFHLYNNSDSGAYVTRCNNLKSYKFENKKTYIMEINNWSTEGSTHSGFGCAFSVFEINANGYKTKLEPIKPTLISCGK